MPNFHRRRRCQAVAHAGTSSNTLNRCLIMPPSRHRGTPEKNSDFQKIPKVKFLKILGPPNWHSPPRNRSRYQKAPSRRRGPQAPPIPVVPVTEHGGRARPPPGMDKGTPGRLRRGSQPPQPSGPPTASPRLRTTPLHREPTNLSAPRSRLLGEPKSSV